MRFFITGDTHGNLTRVINFIKRFKLDANDNILILGDAGLFWRKDQEDAKYWIELYEKECNGVHLYWIDGNHENFDIIKSWNCDNKSVYNNSEHIHYCPRGFETFIDIDCGDHIKARKALFLGGADSIDKFRRTKHLTWWEDETISEEDIKNITGSYYYIFTHTCDMTTFNDYILDLCTISGLDQSKIDHSSEEKLDKLFKNILFEEHYFGHFHTNKKLNNKHTCLFEDFIELK